VAGSRPAYVYFNYGAWQQIGALLFERLGPPLWHRLEDQATISLEVSNNSEPMGKLSFDKEATDSVASLLDELLPIARKSRYSCDTGYRAPRNSPAHPTRQCPGRLGDEHASRLRAICCIAHCGRTLPAYTHIFRPLFDTLSLSSPVKMPYFSFVNRMAAWVRPW
jgi:hypothetical protein